MATFAVADSRIYTNIIPSIDRYTTPIAVSSANSLWMHACKDLTCLFQG